MGARSGGRRMSYLFYIIASGVIYIVVDLLFDQ